MGRAKFPLLLLDGDHHGSVLGDHHINTGKALVRKPVQPQRVHPTSLNWRPRCARGEVVQHDHAAFLEQLDDLLARPALRAGGIHEDQRERCMLGQAAPVGMHDVDVVIGEHVHDAVCQLGVELGSDHSSALGRSATQPRGANPAAGTTFRDRSGPGGCQSGEQSASLGPRRLHVTALQRHAECPDHKLGQVGRSAHFNSLPAVQTLVGGSTM